jgi:hypothetical protein
MMALFLFSSFPQYQHNRQRVALSSTIYKGIRTLFYSQYRREIMPQAIAEL